MNPCPGCGAILPDANQTAEHSYRCSSGCHAAFSEVCAYTLSLADPYFLHQLVVDAYAAQHYSESMKPIGINFSLLGLCMVAERGCSGRQVQDLHMRLAKATWPACTPPQELASVTIRDVLQSAPGLERFDAIHEWVEAVWATWSHEHARIRAILSTVLPKE